MSKLMYLEGEVTLELDLEKCIGCGMCETVCPHRVFEVQDRKSAIIDRDACMECGACSINCPTRAIEVNSGVGCVLNRLAEQDKATALAASQEMGYRRPA